MVTVPGGGGAKETDSSSGFFGTEAGAAERGSVGAISPLPDMMCEVLKSVTWLGGSTARVKALLAERRRRRAELVGTGTATSLVVAQARRIW